MTQWDDTWRGEMVQGELLASPKFALLDSSSSSERRDLPLLVPLLLQALREALLEQFWHPSLALAGTPPHPPISSPSIFTSSQGSRTAPSLSALTSCYSSALDSLRIASDDFVKMSMLVSHLAPTLNDV